MQKQSDVTPELDQLCINTIRALAIDERVYGSSHPEVATDLNNLAQLLTATNRLTEAEPVMRRALITFEHIYGPNHPNVATALSNLAQLLGATNRLPEAEPLLRIDYVEVVDQESLERVETCESPALLALAVFSGSTRLIDNARLE